MDKRELIDKFLKEHQYRLFGFILNKVGVVADSEDIFQSVIEKALVKISTLKDPLKFNAWVLTIASNEIKSFYNRRERISDIDIDSIAITNEYNEFKNLVHLAVDGLSSSLKDVFRLRFYHNLSYKKISLICDIDQKRVKSRLYDAKKHIRNILPNLYLYTEFTENYFNKQKESIVMDLKSVELGSYVFSRLSLESQIEFCISAVKKEEFSETLLEAIGKIKKGKDFILLYHSKVVLKELVNFLNICDRYVEKRVIQELEIVNPDIAEAIKSSMFVFEDLIIAAALLINEIFSRVDENLFAKAISVTIPRVRDHILNSLNSANRVSLIKKMKTVNPGWEDGLLAQREVVEKVKEMDLKGEIEVKRLTEEERDRVEMVLKVREKS